MDGEQKNVVKLVGSLSRVQVKKHLMLRPRVQAAPIKLNTAG